MFVCNVKVNGNKLGKMIVILLFIIIITATLWIGYKVIGNSFFKTNDTINQKEIYELTPSNYTNVLKTVHENIDNYIDQKIHFSGYGYRMLDFNENHFG